MKNTKTMNIIEKMNASIKNAKSELAKKNKADTSANVHNVKLALEIASIENMFNTYKQDTNAKYTSLSKLVETEIGLKKTQVNVYRRVGKFMSNEENYKKYSEYSLTIIEKLMPLIKEGSPILDMVDKNTSSRELTKLKKEHANANGEVAKKKATKADIKQAINKCLHSDDLTEVKAMLRNLLADL